MDIVQNKSLRLVTGQFKSNPLDALRLEAGVLSYAVKIDRMSLASVEKALRLPEDHPRFESWSSALPPKNKRLGWKAKGDELLKRLPEEARNRLPMNFYSCPPWKKLNHLEVAATVPGITGRDEPIEVRKSAAISLLDASGADFTIYSDGSATGVVPREVQLQW